MSEGTYVGLDTCFIHGGLFEFDPDSVVTVWIDPETGRPPDVDADGGTIAADPLAVERCVQRPICGPCIARVNEGRRAQGLPEVR